MLMKNALLLKGEKVLLFSGEMHFWRIDPEYWGTCLGQLKAMDLPIVSTYLSWRRHSVSPDENDLTGKTNPRLNVLAFLRLCWELGLWVHLKPGPWICAEEKNGGYPDWLLSDEEILARDNQGRPVLGYFPPFCHRIPSYLHPKYLKHVRKWLTDVDLCIKDFCYPHGPVILLQLDNEPSMAFRDEMFGSDYNLVNVNDCGHYQQWLQRKYSSVRELNLAYGSDYTDFSDVEAPVDLDVKHLGDLRMYTDWVEFKEWLLAKYIEILKEIHLRNGIRDVLFTVNYNQHRPMSVPNNWSKLEQASGLGGHDYYAVPPLQHKDFVDLVRHVNYSLVASKLPWAPEIMCGTWKFEGMEEIPTDLLAGHMETLYFLGLAYGLKGMNFYMLVNRENWKDAPVDEKGQPTETCVVPKKVTSFVRTIKEFPSLCKSRKVAIMYYRPYAWEAYVATDKGVIAKNIHLGKAYRLFETLYAALLNLNYDPAICDPFVNSEVDISCYHLIFVPSGTYMDEGTQRLLKGYAESGGVVVFFPQLPYLDLHFRPCSCIGKGVEHTEVQCHQKLRFSEHLLGKGKITLVKHLSFCQEVGSENERDLDLLGSFLRYYGLMPEVEADDRHIFTVLQGNELERILFVIDVRPKPREVKLRFQEISTGKLEEIFLGEQVLTVKGGETTLATQGEAVWVFRILEQAE